MSLLLCHVVCVLLVKGKTILPSPPEECQEDQVAPELQPKDYTALLWSPLPPASACTEAQTCLTLNPFLFLKTEGMQGRVPNMSCLHRFQHMKWMNYWRRAPGTIPHLCEDIDRRMSWAWQRECKCASQSKTGSGLSQVLLWISDSHPSPERQLFRTENQLWEGTNNSSDIGNREMRWLLFSQDLERNKQNKNEGF